MYRDLFSYYLARGGDASRETTFGNRNWDEIVNPEIRTKLEVVFNHDTSDVRAVRPDRTVILVGNITASWGHQESSRWFREPNRGGVNRRGLRLQEGVPADRGRYRLNLGINP